MMPERWSIIGLAVVALVVCAAPEAIAQPASAPSLAAKSSDGGGVRVVVKPKRIDAGSAWEFEVTMDTHSKSLSEDLTKAAVLVDDSGRRYTPVAWQGDPPGGHHRKGVLSFPAPPGSAKSFELQMQGIGGVSQRLFQWTGK